MISKMVKAVAASAAFLFVAPNTFAGDVAEGSKEWSGFYLGGIAGYDLATVDNSGFGYYAGYSGPGCAAMTSLYDDCLVVPHHQVGSFIGGLEAGYNWQMGKGLLGVEADVQTVNVNTASALGYYDPGFAIDPGHTVTTTLDAFSTVRLRAGYLISDRMLGYVTGGLAALHVKGNFDDNGENDTFGQPVFVLGWAAGAGLEYRMAKNWSVKAEGLYISSLTDLQAGTNSSEEGAYSYRSNINQFVGRIGVNYHFAAPSAFAGDVAEGGKEWSGFYLGGIAGYDSATVDNSGFGYYAGDSGPGCAVMTSLDDDCLVVPHQQAGSFTGGVEAGYNWQIGRGMLGVETDIQTANLSAANAMGYYYGGFVPEDGHTVTTTLDAFGTVRLRAGYLISDNMLGYVTGGLAALHVKGNFEDGGDNDTYGQAVFALGWAAGAGLEYRIAKNWSVKVEGLYISSVTDLQAGTSTSEDENYSYRSNINQFVGRLGVNYHF